jgi:hypothetical protein
MTCNIVALLMLPMSSKVLLPIGDHGVLPSLRKVAPAAAAASASDAGDCTSDSSTSIRSQDDDGT